MFEVKRAYRQKCLVEHPDKAQKDETSQSVAKERFQNLTHAYELINAAFKKTAAFGRAAGPGGGFPPSKGPGPHVTKGYNNGGGPPPYGGGSGGSGTFFGAPPRTNPFVPRAPRGGAHGPGPGPGGPGGKKGAAGFQTKGGGAAGTTAGDPRKRRYTSEDTAEDVRIFSATLILNNIMQLSWIARSFMLSSRLYNSDIIILIVINRHKKRLNQVTYFIRKRKL